MTTEVVRVTTPYGGRYYVSAADLAGAKRHMLPLYTRGGQMWEDTPAGQRAIKRGEGAFLVRGNILAARQTGG